MGKNKVKKSCPKKETGYSDTDISDNVNFEDVSHDIIKCISCPNMTIHFNNYGGKGAYCSKDDLNIRLFGKVECPIDRK